MIRDYSCTQIASKVNATPSTIPISATTIWRTLVAEGYSIYKRTVKPGLNEENKKNRLQ
jgi:hypothetical protein